MRDIVQNMFVCLGVSLFMVAAVCISYTTVVTW